MLAGAVAGVITAPIAVKYVELEKDPAFRRGADEGFSTHPADFLAPAGRSYLYKPLDRAADRAGLTLENRLFPGFLATALAFVGLGMVVLRSGETRLLDDVRLKAFWSLAFACLVIFVFSLGRSVVVGERSVTLPYGLVGDHLPGLAAIRATSRFIVVPLLGLAVAAAIGVAKLIGGLPRPAAMAVTIILAVIMLGEYGAAITIAQDPQAPAFTAVNRTLASLPPGPVLELPMGDPSESAWAYVEAPRMLLSAIDWHPRVNGYSGFSSPGYQDVVAIFNSLASDQPATDYAFRALRILKVRYIVLRTAAVAEDGPGPPSTPGVAYYNESQVAKVESEFPPGTIRSVRGIGSAVLIELR